MIERLARATFRHYWRVIAAWIAAMVVIFAFAGRVGSDFGGGLEVPESESRDGLDVLESEFGGAGAGLTGSIVFRADAGIDDPAVRAAMEKLFAEADALEGITVVSPYEGPGALTQVSDDRTTAFANVDIDPSMDQRAAGEAGVEIAELRPEIDGLTVEIGGSALSEFEPPESELIGIAFAIVVLIVSFGSVLAMGLPIAVAVAGVGSGIGLVTLLSNLQTMPDFASTIGAMIGLGVGIDYALFIVTRYREAHRRGLSGEDSVVEALDTAGRAVLFAGATVVVSLLGMLLIGLSFVAGLGIAAAVTVAVTMLASVTLLPALLGLAGARVEVTRWRGLIAAGLVAVALLGVGLGVQPLLVGAPLAVVVLLAGFAVAPLRAEVPPRRVKPIRQTVAYKWSRQIQAHPWISVGVGVAALAAFALPVTSLRLGFSDEGNYGTDTTTRRAYDMLADGFGPGFNGPLLVTVQPGDDAARARIEDLAAAIAADPGVAEVGFTAPSDMESPETSAAYLVQVIPATAPQDEATDDLVERLRSDVIPEVVGDADLTVNVSGFVAVSVDFTNYLAERIILFLGVVLALSFLLLMAVFRSLLVPLKAVVMNMLSIAAAYGVVVAIFQWGWLGGLFDVEPAPIEPFIPMMLFAIVFGLSMDYEVFLLSRVKEEYDRTGDAVTSVADGLAATARVITAAAAIMIVVFGSFMFEDNRITRMFGLGLAVAVFLDATLVRMLLVPATMELLGERNWWLPRWLDRIIPHLHIEGSGHDIDHALDEVDDVDAPEAAEPPVATPV